MEARVVALVRKTLVSPERWWSLVVTAYEITEALKMLVADSTQAEYKQVNHAP